MIATASGLVVSGSNQVVGGIDGSGTTQVYAGSDLTADHIFQSALVIGGTSGSGGLVTIAASDASGNPLGQPGWFALVNSLSSSEPSGERVISSTSLSTESDDRAVPTIGRSIGTDNPAPVPEPSALLLVLLAVLGVVSARFGRDHFRCQTI